MLIFPHLLIKEVEEAINKYFFKTKLYLNSPLGAGGYLSHQTLVSKSSAPILEIASFTLVLFTEISEFG